MPSRKVVTMNILTSGVWDICSFLIDLYELLLYLRYWIYSQHTCWKYGLHTSQSKGPYALSHEILTVSSSMTCTQKHPVNMHSI